MFSSSQMTLSPMCTDENYDSSQMAWIYEDCTNGEICSMEAEVSSIPVDDDSQDSGISCDSSDYNSSGCSENLFVTTGPTNFNKLSMKKSPDLPASFMDDLDDLEREAAESLTSSWKNKNFRPKPSGRRTPLKDITANVQSRYNVVESSPISTKSTRTDLKYSRKRSIRSYVNQEMEKLPRKKRPLFHRAFSTSELEIQRNYDSSPENATKYSLKIEKSTRPSDVAFGRIESKVLEDLIDEMGEAFYEKYILVDCRYPFEYNGGHIKGAINLFDPLMLRSTFYPSTENDLNKIHSKTPIFYCEYSSVRGPKMANALRELDRQLNHDRYPYVDYQEIYVLSQGYRHFYRNVSEKRHCEPQNYVSMNCKQHHHELQQYSFHQKSVSFGLSFRSYQSW